MRSGVAASVLVVLAISKSAWAQTARAPGEHVHDGLYLQLGIGPTLIRDSFDSDGRTLLFPETSGTVTGFGHAQHLAIGGAVAPGFVIAGAVAADVARTTTVDYEGGAVNPSDDYVLFTLGPMIDVYFDPERGTHALFGGGLGITSGVEPEGVDGGSGSGFGLFAGVGHEWWVSAEWGIGALLRLNYVRAEESVVVLIDDTFEVQHSAIGVALLFSATYN